MTGNELRVIIAPQGSEAFFRFSRGDRHLALGSRPEPGRLAPLKASLSEDLALVRRELRRGRATSWDEARAAVAEIKKIGGWLLHDLLGADAPRAEELENFLRFVVPEWRERQFDGIEIRIEPSPNCPPDLAAFPFEFLPVFDRALPPPLANMHELATAVCGILGYAAVLVRRRAEDDWTDPMQLTRDNTGRVPVMIFRDAKSLKRVTEEISYLARGTDAFRVVASWPTRISDPHEDALASALFANSRAGASSPEVHHFCCHYETGPHGAFGFWDSEGNKRIRVTLRDLKAARIRLNGPRRAVPLVFLNACESSAYDPTGALSLIEILRQDGNAAIVGAETSIPDDAASFFAQRVFSRLARQEPLGRAVLRARWDLVEEWRNPAGIFFSLHGRTDLRIN